MSHNTMQLKISPPPFFKGIKQIVLPHLWVISWFFHSIHIGYVATTWLVFCLFTLFWCPLLLCCCCCYFKKIQRGELARFLQVPKMIPYKNFFVSPSLPSATPLQLPGSAFCSYEKVSLTVLIFKWVLTQISYSEVWFYRMQVLPILS